LPLLLSNITASFFAVLLNLNRDKYYIVAVPVVMLNPVIEKSTIDY
jgi:hypothetical protein